MVMVFNFFIELPIQRVYIPYQRSKVSIFQTDWTGFKEFFFCLLDVMEQPCSQHFLSAWSGSLWVMMWR